jgi:hypothetical protein
MRIGNSAAVRRHGAAQTSRSDSLAHPSGLNQSPVFSKISVLLQSAQKPAPLFSGPCALFISLFCIPKVAKSLFSIHCVLFAQKHGGWGHPLQEILEDFDSSGCSEGHFVELSEGEAYDLHSSGAKLEIPDTAANFDLALNFDLARAWPLGLRTRGEIDATRHTTRHCQ